jgi:sulfite exporter TauE/SafE
MIINGLIFGLISTLHCVGMCGPLALAVPSKVESNKWIFALFYQIGRIGVYILIGSIAFSIGFSFSMFKLQQVITIVFGSLLVVYALFSFFNFKQFPFVRKYNDKLSKQFGAAMKLKPLQSALSLGVLNGLLPCGAIYIAAIYCSSFSSFYEASAYMFLFGIGTMPVFIMAWLLVSKKLNFKLQQLKWVYKTLPLIIGLLMIIRGANLGIQYLSPKIEASAEKTEIKGCCKHK